MRIELTLEKDGTKISIPLDHFVVWERFGQKPLVQSISGNQKFEVEEEYEDIMKIIGDISAKQQARSYFGTRGPR